MTCRLFCIMFFLIAPYKSFSEDKVLKKLDFQNILLVINFNSHHYSNIDFLKEIYSSAFPNIVFYGSGKDPRVIQISDYRGFYNHGSLVDAMNRFPNYAGYLFVQDDCFFNYWNFDRLNKDKIWFHSKLFIESLDVVNMKWNWWNQVFGRRAAIEAIKKLPKKYIEILNLNLGKYRVAFAWSDLFYVPRRLRKNYIEVAKCFLNPKVFCEIAIPTILCSLDSIQEWENLNVVWGKSLEHYTPDIDWFHPIKFSSRENREFIRQIVSNYGLLCE
ncbi:MAG: hypothetical protein WDZ27_02860 [Waddliaceae bacterium]